MMRGILRIKWITFISTMICAFSVAAQNGNEWINYDQQYWKFPVSEDGLYRISYNDLQNGGFPVSSVDPHHIRIYGRGKESPIFISGEDDGAFQPGDYIELYARRNDGWLDSLAYVIPNELANPAYSLFNDTAHYFITIDDENGLRRTWSSATNFKDYTPRNYCFYKSEKSFHAEYLLGKQDINGIGLPTYDAAEGWFDYRFSMGASHTTGVATSGAYTGSDAPAADVSCNSASASLAIGFPNHHLQVGWGEPFQLAIDTSYYGYQLNHLNFTIPAAQLSPTTTSIIHRSIDDLNLASDYHAVSYVNIDYAHTFDFQNTSSFLFSLDNPNQESYALVEISNFNSSNPRLFVLLPEAITEIQVVNSNGLYQALIPLNQTGRTQLWMMDDMIASESTGISPVSQSGYFFDYTSIELQHAFIIVTHPLLMSSAQNYGVWRNNGEMESLVADVEQLYMQYAFGIWKNPIAIRRFCNDLIESWVNPPEHLFLMGKSIHEGNFSATIGARNDPAKYHRNLVPTWGYPGSDALFTAGLNGTLHQSAIPTGRLAAQNQDQVLEYLNKVIEHETQPADLWQKNIMHFGGGTIAYEQALFRSYLETYEDVVEDTCFGGVVYSFYKNTTDPIQMNVSDSIQLLINEGVSLMTFFGHASSTGFDQNIDTPESYSNQGKYPMLIGNSCYTGNIHLSESQSASENFVLVPDRGMIGFLAKSDLGIPVYLNLFTDRFYKEFSQSSYGKSVGQCMKKSVEGFQVAGDFYRMNTAYNFSLHGDPAIHLHPQEKPDYRIKPSNIIFEPADITASVSSFDVKVRVENIGKATHDDVGIELIRHYPDGTDSSYVIIADEIFHHDTIVFHVPNNTGIAAGENFFDVYIDYPLNIVPELEDVSNNIVQGKSLLITSGDLFPVVPYAFEVVPDNDIVLKASTGFAFEPLRNYVIQVDTTDLFNSPMFHTSLFSQTGGVVEWPLPFVPADSMVVFWRCSADSTSPDNSYNWYNSSFQYISGKEGWGQDHFFQFRKNHLTNLEYDEQERQWNFNPTTAHFKCQVYGSASSTFEALATRYQLNLNVLEYGGYGYDVPALMVAVLDSSTFIPWESNYNGLNPDHDFGNTLASANARSRPERYFIFQQNDATQLEGFISMMEEIPDSQYVLIYTWQLAQKDNWQSLAPEVEDVFENLGAEAIAAAPDSIPFILFCKKGFPGSLIEIVGGDADDYIVLETDLVGAMGSGNMLSPLIGPSGQWNWSSRNFSTLDPTAGDQSRFKIHGVDWQGADYSLAEFPQSGTIEDLSLYVNAEQFPFLRLEAIVTDTTHQTSPQTDAWHVLYETAPECAVNPIHGFYQSADSIDQGQYLKLAVAIENIGRIDMDSLKVSYKIEDENHIMHPLYYPMQEPLLTGHVLLDTIEIDSRELSGNNIIHIEVNPIDPQTGIPHQREQTHFNNLAKTAFYVQPDDINPILDVTFDGQHIISEDIVSAQPHIVITLDDENQYFIMNEESDTSRFRIYITSPAGNLSQVYFSSTELEWSPASGSENRCRIDYTPTLEIDGKWKLRVQGSDKNGNISGDLDYEIEFNIRNKPTITEVMNYPNPFSTRTQFVFTLTGTIPPDQFKIQIMTINGDIVREITQDEIGPLRIGRNLTEYWWDGTDEFGDRLANGVYLYRVLAKLNGNSMEMNETSASRYFNRGFGKMYLFR